MKRYWGGDCHVLEGRAPALSKSRTCFFHCSSCSCHFRCRSYAGKPQASNFIKLDALLFQTYVLCTALHVSVCLSAWLPILCQALGQSLGNSWPTYKNQSAQTLKRFATSGNPRGHGKSGRVELLSDLLKPTSAAIRV